MLNLAERLKRSFDEISLTSRGSSVNITLNNQHDDLEPFQYSKTLDLASAEGDELCKLEYTTTLKLNRPVYEFPETKLDEPNSFLSWDDLQNLPYRHISHQSSRLTEIVLNNATNLVLGLQTELSDWNDRKMEFLVSQNVLGTRIGLLLEHCALNGTYMCRLSKAARDLRDSFDAGIASQPIASLSAAINHELMILQTRGQSLYLQKTLTAFLLESQPIFSETNLLAILIGCKTAGKVSAIPKVADLLNRAYFKAYTTGSEMLWRLVFACLRPWIEQLNFVIGLRDSWVPKTFDESKKVMYFPDMFLEFDSNGVFILNQEVPDFVPQSVASAVLKCYRLLVSLQNEREIAIPQFTEPLCLDSDQKPGLKLTEQPGIKPIESRSHKEPNFTEIWGTVLIQANNLDMFVHQALFREIQEFLDVVINVYLIHNGYLWSLICDAIDLEGYKKDLRICEILEDYPVKFHKNKLQYKMHPAIQVLFGDEFLQTCEFVFHKLLEMRNSSDLALYTSKLDEYTINVQRVFNDKNCGIERLVSESSKISQFLI